MTKNEVVQTLLESRQILHSKLRHRLQKAQEVMKRYADAKRDDIAFDVGQWVFVKLRPGRQTSVVGLRHSKLSKHFFGPFQIVERIGQVAYRLHLPPESQIHPIFHCSLLHPHHGPPPATDYGWPLQVLENKPLQRPMCFLDSKLDQSTTPPTRLVLTQWEGEPPEDTSWEMWSDLCKTYHLEDKVDFREEGSVSNIDICQATPRPARTKKVPLRLRDYHVKGLLGMRE